MLLSWLDRPAEGLSSFAIWALVLAIEEGVEAATRSKVSNSSGLSSGRNRESRTVRMNEQASAVFNLRVIKHERA
jgi:hypothetical protein